MLYWFEVWFRAHDPEALACDIFEASDRTANPIAVQHLVREGPRAVEELLLDELQVPFDRDAKGGPNKRPVTVRITDAELAAFKAGIA